MSPVPGKTHLSSHVLSPKRNERNYSSKICPSSIEDRERKFTGNKGTKEGKEKKLGSRNTVYRHVYISIGRNKESPRNVTRLLYPKIINSRASRVSIMNNVGVQIVKL